LRILAAILVAATVAGCTTTPRDPSLVWLRLDGIPIEDNAERTEQFLIDKANCDERVAEARADEKRNEPLYTVMLSCMTEHGYKTGYL